MGDSISIDRRQYQLESGLIYLKSNTRRKSIYKRHIKEKKTIYYKCINFIRYKIIKNY